MDWFFSLCLIDWLSVCLFVCVCVCVCPSVWLAVSLSVSLSVCLSVCLEIYYYLLAVYYKISCLAQSWPDLHRDLIIKCLGDAGFNTRTLVSCLYHWARMSVNKKDWLIEWWPLVSFLSCFSKKKIYVLVSVHQRPCKNNSLKTCLCRSRTESEIVNRTFKLTSWNGKRYGLVHFLK